MAKRFLTNKKTKMPFPVGEIDESTGTVQFFPATHRRQMKSEFTPAPSGTVSDRYMGSIERPSGKNLTFEDRDRISGLLTQLGVEDDDLFEAGFDHSSPFAYDFYIYGHKKARDAYNKLTQAGFLADIDFDTEEENFRRQYPEEIPSDVRKEDTNTYYEKTA